MNKFVSMPQRTTYIGGRSLTALVAVASAFTVASASEVLWNNGPMVTHSGAGPGGLDVSNLQSTSLSLAGFGYGAPNTVFRVADDFQCDDPLGWDIKEIEVYGYQTNATTVTLNLMNWKIWDNSGNSAGTGPGYPGATVEVDRSGSNQADVFNLTNVYRIDGIAPFTNVQRRVQRAIDNVTTPLTVGNGVHWLDFALGGTSASGPWVPPTTLLGSFNTLKLQSSRQYSVTSNQWFLIGDAGVAGAYSAAPKVQDLPFVLRGLTLTIKVSGNVHFLSRDGSAPALVSADMEIRDSGTTNVLKSMPNTTLDGAGNFVITTNPVVRGTYDLAVRRDGYLRKVLGFNTTNSNPTIGTFNLIAGDADPDNEVNIVDAATISTAFGSSDGDPNWNPLADCDGDGEVNLIDASIVSTNFGLEGDE